MLYVAGSFLVWFLMYHFVSRWISKLLIKDLPDMTRVEFNNRLIASVHSVVLSYLAFDALYFDDNASQLQLNKVTGTTPASEFCVAVILGYYVFDLILVFMHYNEMRMPHILVWHHTGVLFPYLMVHFYGEFSYWSLYCALTEMTVVFSNNHWILTKTNLRKSRFFTLNLLFLLMFYLIFRLVNLLTVLAEIFRERQIVWENGHLIASMTCLAGTLIILIMSISWFIMASNLFVATLGRSSKSSADAKKMGAPKISRLNKWRMHALQVSYTGATGD